MRPYKPDTPETIARKTAANRNRQRKDHIWRRYGQFGRRITEAMDEETQIEETVLPSIKVRTESEDRNWADEILNPE